MCLCIFWIYFIWLPISSGAYRAVNKTTNIKQKDDDKKKNEKKNPTESTNSITTDSMQWSMILSSLSLRLSYTLTPLFSFSKEKSDWTSIEPLFKWNCWCWYNTSAVCIVQCVCWKKRSMHKHFNWHYIKMHILCASVSVSVSARLQSFSETKETDSTMTILRSISLITASQSMHSHAHTSTNALSAASIDRL